MRLLVLLLVFIAACEGAVVTEEWPDTPQREPVQPKEFVPIEADPVEAETFSLIEEQERVIVVNGTEHTMLLFEIIDGRARMRVDDLAFMIGVNETVTRSGVELTLRELMPDAIVVPLVSTVDVSIGGKRVTIAVGETFRTENYSVAVDFIGLDEEPKVRLVSGMQSAILAEDDEQRFDDFWVYVHHIYFNDATEHKKADAITVSVTHP